MEGGAGPPPRLRPPPRPHWKTRMAGGVGGEEEEVAMIDEGYCCLDNKGGDGDDDNWAEEGEEEEGELGEAYYRWGQEKPELRESSCDDTLLLLHPSSPPPALPLLASGLLSAGGAALASAAAELEASVREELIPILRAEIEAEWASREWRAREEMEARALPSSRGACARPRRSPGAQPLTRPRRGGTLQTTSCVTPCVGRGSGPMRRLRACAAARGRCWIGRGGRRATACAARRVERPNNYTRQNWSRVRIPKTWILFFLLIKLYFS